MLGDQIQVEAVMVNTRGSPEETIEFSGINNVQESDDVIDNKVDIRFQKYITNRQQFNANLPMFYTNLKQTNSQLPDYGYLDFSTFAFFVNHFPYRGIEGMYISSVDANNAPVYSEVDAGGGIYKTPKPC